MPNIKEAQSNGLYPAFNSSQELRYTTLGNSYKALSTIVFIDSAVDEYQSLVNGAIPEAEVIVLDSTRDGVVQITQVLQGRINIAAVHIVSHGSPGCLYLGNTELSLDTLERYVSQLQTWATHLTSSALLLYGCNVAAGDAGEEFLERLHRLTGANIAASANRTGSGELGGDWELEVTTGKVEFPLAFSVEVREAYASVLADVNLSGTILWTDGGGNTHPVREATVEIWDSEGFLLSDERVTTVRTDVNGKYSSTFNNNDGIFQGNRDIYIKVLADSPFHYVSSDGKKGNTYSQKSWTVDEIPNGTNTIDLTIGNTTNADRAFSVSDALYTSELYTKTVRGDSPILPILSAKFPENATEKEDKEKTSSYFDGQMSILLSDRWDWDVINHEYGHFLAEKDSLIKLPIPSGKHIFGVSNIPASPTEEEKKNGVQLAWSEGLADYLGIAAQNVANATGGLPSVFNENGTNSTGDTFYTETIQQSFTFDLEGKAGSGNAGEGDEVSVMRILWDIADDAQDFFSNSNGLNGLRDVIALGHKELYNILNNNILDNNMPSLDQLDDVWDYFYGISNDATRVNYGAIFEEYDVSPAPFGGPINQTFQLGSAIPTFQWEKNNNNANDKFQVIVFNNDFSTRENYEVKGDVTQWTPDPDQWSKIIATPGDYHFVIAGSDTNGFTTGSYWSGAYNFLVDYSNVTVTTLEDEDDGNLSPNDISLREAIRFVNPGGTINFDPSLTGGTITLTQGELAINKDLTINGLGADELTISGNKASRVFRIDDGTSNLIDVEIKNLTIASGNANAGGNVGEGGGILNREKVTLSDSTLSDNIAAFGGGIENKLDSTLILSNSTLKNNQASSSGGGIDNSGNLTVNNSTLSGNTAALFGGGIDNSGNLTVNNSTLSGNQANDGGGIEHRSDTTLTVNNSTISDNTATSFGAGIDNFGDTVIVTNSTISSNTAGENGGGINNFFGNTLTILNSTISGNKAGNFGGGIQNGENLTVKNSTITANIADNDSNGTGDGGGINNFLTGTVEIQNTIVAKNFDNSPAPTQSHPDVSGSFSTTNSNLIGNATGSTGFTNGVNGNIVGTSTNPIDPKLGDLQNNGGSTFTHALLDGSPAINAGNNANIPADITTDQRGEPRIVGGTVDIGAFESAFTPVVLPIIVTPGDDTVTGTPGNDTVISGGGQDQIFGGSGDDSLDGGDGDDRVSGGEDNDTLLGGSGQDQLFGDSGNDSLDGGDGDDRISGGDGNDTLLGGQGQDRLFGDSGDDLLNGGTGDNILTGGTGKDIFVVSTAGKNNIVDFEDGQDLLKLEGGLTFGQLSIFEQNGDTWITTKDNQPLAFLTGVNSNLITAADFTM